MRLAARFVPAVALLLGVGLVVASLLGGQIAFSRVFDPFLDRFSIVLSLPPVGLAAAGRSCFSALFTQGSPPHSDMPC